MELQDVKKTKEIKLYSLMEVASFMGITYMTLYRLVKNGRISSINVSPDGKKPLLKISPEELQRYYNTISSTTPGDKGINQ